MFFFSNDTFVTLLYNFCYARETILLPYTDTKRERVDNSIDIKVRQEGAKGVIFMNSCF